jgi:hypothetical protein
VGVETRFDGRSVLLGCPRKGEYPPQAPPCTLGAHDKGACYNHDQDAWFGMVNGKLRVMPRAGLQAVGSSLPEMRNRTDYRKGAR